MESWISLNESSGTGVGEVEVDISVNMLSVSRGGSITITTASGLTKTVSISQGTFEELGLSRNEITISGPMLSPVLQEFIISVAPSVIVESQISIEFVISVNNGFPPYTGNLLIPEGSGSPEIVDVPMIYSNGTVSILEHSPLYDDTFYYPVRIIRPLEDKS